MSLWSRLKLVTAPASLAVALSSEKSWVRKGDFTDDDNDLTAALNFAIGEIDGPNGWGIALLSQTWDLKLDCFPVWELAVPLGPVTSITSITYLDMTGASQTLDPANYRVDLGMAPARITPAYGLAWPSTRPVTGAVSVRFVAGYADAAALLAAKSDVVAAIQILAANYDESRGGKIDFTTVDRIKAKHATHGYGS